ncbi:toxin glutamine deamidase domain-containing protein [Streptomyces fulvoviolaceus]|uniref:toxin glutamine deamidase domain-containing protein n=1 Tax=Streptomyces fulvoviolaceus TaxID=285535 RepID=UPI00131B727C|nr:toxin glutamine deamidase domain-containing protein [Streptomyces fulvoviolaceus]
MMLPDELEWVLEMLGYNWPTADEDKLRESAALWRQFGDDVTGLHERANGSARQVTAYNAGESIDAFTKTYAKFDGGGGSDGYLASAAQSAHLIAGVLETCAGLVVVAKYAVIVQLIALAIEILAAHAAAPFTFGLSEVAGLGATQITRLIVRRLLDELKDAILDAIVETMKEPVISAVEAIITDLIRQSVNVGFGAQSGYDLSTTAKAGADGAWEAVKSSPQTFLEGVRDSLGAKAGSSAHHAIDSRIDGYNGGSSGTSGASGSEGGSGSGDGDGGSDSSSSGSDSSSSGSNSSSSGSDSSSNGSGSSSSTQSGNGTNIGGGISADTGGNGVGGPDVGSLPGSDSGSGSDNGSGQDSSSSETSTPRPTPVLNGPTLSDFDDPSPSGSSPAGTESGGSSGPSHSGGGSSVSGLSSPTVQSAPAQSSSGGTSSPSGGGAIGTNIDSLAASVPTQTNTAAAAPTTSDPSPAGAGAGRADGGSSGIPSSPVASAAAGGSGGAHQGGGTSGSSGGASSATSPSSPTPNSGATRTTSASVPGTPSTAGTGPVSTPSTTAPASTPRSTPTSDARVPGTADGRTPGTSDNRIPTTQRTTPGSTTPGDGTTPRTTTPGDGTTSRSTPGSTTPGDRTTPRGTTPGDGTTPRHTTPGDGTTSRTTPGNTTPGDGTTSRNTPGNTTPGDRTTPRGTAPGDGTRTNTPSQNPSTSTPTTTPSTSTNTGTGTGTGSDRTSTPGNSTSNSAAPSSRTPNSAAPPAPAGNPTTPGTPGAQNTPTRTPQQHAGSTPGNPGTPGGTPNTPPQPAAQPSAPPQSAPQHQQQVTAVPIHTVIRTPGASTPAAAHHSPATPHAPGSPQNDAGTPQNGQQHPQQDSLADIRSDLDHHPGGLTEPDTADQQALVDAVPHNEDGTPERFPDPFGSWSQLQNDGGNTVPGRSNNCADCSRSFLETWYGDPQVSAPRTIDTDANGKPDPFAPESNANENQIRWAGAAHTYVGPGGDPDTANTIANTLRQAGPGSAAIVQVGWPGGGGHAFNVVNHNGNIVWIDTQSGEVSNEPLHLDKADHVWHIPLDADRNPIDTSQPHTEDTNHSEEGTATSQDGTESTETNTNTPQNGTTTPQDGTETSETNTNTPQNDTTTPQDGTETSETKTDTPQEKTDTPQEGTDASQQETSDSTEGSQHQPDSPGESPDAAASGDPAHAEPSPTADSSSATPESGNGSHKDTVTDDAVPSSSPPGPNEPTTDRSTPQQTPAPDSHTASASASASTSTDNAGGHTTPNQAPATSTNAASPRPGQETPGTPAQPHRGPEAPAGTNDGSNKKHKLDDEPDAPKPKKPKKTPAERAAEIARAREIANTPLDSSGPEGHPGYGVVQDGDGSSVHHDMLGDESQDLLRVTNEVVQTDLHSIAQHLHNWAEGNPSPLQQTIREASESGRLTQDRLNELLKPGFAEMSREDKAATVAAIARLSSGFHNTHAVDDSGGADLHSRHKPTRGENLDPAPLARRYAATQDIADKEAQELAENSQALGDSNQPKTEKEISRERLKFNKLWNQHVGEAQLAKAIKQAESEGRPQAEIDAMREHRSMMRPDFSGKNFAALEVIEHKPDGSTETHYIIDSSNPPLDHSEPVLGEAFRRLDQENPGRYEAPLMYTEFEPCGNQTYPASANCSDYLAHEFERPADQDLKKYHEKSAEERAAVPEQKNSTKVVYGAGYRLGELSADEMARINALPPEQKAAEVERARQQAVDARNADMHRFRGELARVWMKLAASADVP